MRDTYANTQSCKSFSTPKSNQESTKSIIDSVSWCECVIIGWNIRPEFICEQKQVDMRYSNFPGSGSRLFKCHP